MSKVEAAPDAGTLDALGYSERWQALFEPHAAVDLIPGRVIRSDRGSALIAAASGIARAKPSAHLMKAAEGPAELPVVGDWVAARVADDLEVGLIEAVLPRASAVTRGAAGRRSDLQVLAANVDTVFVVHPIAGPPNLRRIERELSLAWESGAVPVVVLTKADLSADVGAARSGVESVAVGVVVLATNALAADGAEPLLAHVRERKTAVLIGPSGAGKSTLINTLLGERRQATREVRVGDGRGRHTTVARELIGLPGGGILIDTPGLRELGLTGSEEGIASTFPEIERLARECRFRDCTHGDEPGCAVTAAVAAGALPAGRVTGYRKLLREAEVAAARTDARLQVEEKRRGKILGRAIKGFLKRTDKV